MKRIASLALVCALVLAMPLGALAEYMYVVTPNGGSVNMREGPSTDDAVVTSVPYGAGVDVIEQLFGSSFVNVNYNGYYGYISIRYLSDYPPSPNPTFWPTFVPAPTSAPTARPTSNKGGGNTLETELSRMFAGFNATDYTALVVPSTPTTYVNMRWAPSKSAPVRGQYWAGTMLQVISTNGDWAEVVDMNTEVHGFMMTHFLNTTNVGAAGADS